MQKPEYYAAVYGIIRNSDGDILFGERQNTGYMDGYFQLPAGHIEGEETYLEALKREMKEETNIDVKEAVQVYIDHRISINNRVYFDIYFEILKYTGEIKNNELDKCRGLSFLNSEDVTKKKMVEHTTVVLKEIEKGEKSGEHVYK